MTRRLPRPGRVTLVSILAALTLTTAGLAAVTFATLTDEASLGLGTTGVGFAHRFDIAVVLPDGSVEQADSAGGYSWRVAGAETLVPGRSVKTTIPVFNNTPNLAAAVDIEIVLSGDGSVGSAPNITKFLRFTAKDSAGTVLFHDVGWATAKADLGVLAARGGAALSQGGTYAAGATGSEDTITLTIDYPESTDTEDYNGGLSAFSVRIHATSTKEQP